MTEEEVQMIYDYLHENYEYKDGNLVAKKNKIGATKGHSLGTFNINENNSSGFLVQIKIKNKRFARGLHQYIYLYHNKSLPKYVMHLDGNVTNNKIENLIKYNGNKVNANRDHKGYFQDKKGFRVVMSWDKKKKTYGNFSSEQIAMEVFSKIKYLRYKKNLSHQEINKIINTEYWDKKIKNDKNIRGYKQEGGKYVARIRIKNKQITLGRFDSAQEAHQVYLKAKENHAKNTSSIPA